MEFWKYQGTGNDFIIIDGRFSENHHVSELAKAICDRHYGIGADGLLVALGSKKAEANMVYYNADGSPASMCGNGIRCFSKFLRDAGIVTRKSFLVDTGDGIKQIRIRKESRPESTIEAAIGSPSGLRSIVVSRLELIHMQLGVPHSVLFLKPGRVQDPVGRLGPWIEKNPAFSAGTNVNFVELEQDGGLGVQTWERGVGRTLACGTGACASAVAACWVNGIGPYGKTPVSAAVVVRMPGGEVRVTLEGGSVSLTGPATLIGRGLFDVIGPWTQSSCIR